jgi:IS5 family transposase
MKHQYTLDTSNFHGLRKQIRREVFLNEMDALVPWGKMVNIIKPYYPKAGNGRHPYQLEQMLRIYCLQLWYDISDPMMEEMLYDSRAMGEFAGVDYVRGMVPDETTIGNFRRLIEEHGLAKKIMKCVNDDLSKRGVRMGKGTIVDATIIEAPTSTKNQDKERDPEMATTVKHGQKHFGMKAHVGVDARTKLIHTVEVTAANENDVVVAHQLVRKTDTCVWGDKGYVGAMDSIQTVAPEAKDCILRKKGYKKALSKGDKRINKARSRVRARVEHVFHVMKNLFHFKKVRYKGLAKNENRVTMTCALINIYLSRLKLEPA